MERLKERQREREKGSIQYEGMCVAMAVVINIL